MVILFANLCSGANSAPEVVLNLHMVALVDQLMFHLSILLGTLTVLQLLAQFLEILFQQLEVTVQSHQTLTLMVLPLVLL